MRDAMATGFFSHPVFLQHDMGPHHPECPDRLRAIEDQLIASRLDSFLEHRTAPAATDAQLARVHPTAFITALEALAPSQGYAMVDPDTSMNPFTRDAARHAAGAAIAATDAVLAGEFDNAFCSVRPPGHHAEPSRAMGFCFYNNVAVAACHALEHHGLARVAIIDFDVHHGNGTEAAFRDDPRVLMCGIFQHPFYPYSGADCTASNMVNTPVPAYTDGARVREIVETDWLPKLHAFVPEMIFISAGFDAHREDDLGLLGLVEADYAWITAQLLEIARVYAQGRLVSCLEGGYNLSALGRSVAAHLKVLVEG
jgi:acetoin utilization deacetylase AcuC-like enzyme